jgi:hypothetical protein
MQPQELELQIKKFKARRLKTKLAHYGTLISLFLAFSTLSNGYHLSSLFSLLITLPLPLYFALQSLKLARKSRDLKTRMESLGDLIYGLTHPKFSIRKFLTQPNLAFRLSLALFFLVFMTTLARIRTPDPTLTMSHAPLTINH